MEELGRVLAKREDGLLLRDMRILPLLTALVTALAVTGRAQMVAAAYEVYAVRFATFAKFPTRSLVAGADSTRRSPIAFTVWLMRGGGHTVLMDAGFYREKFRDRWPGNFSAPSEAIAPLGIKPEDITDIIISHVHWDHLDGADLFPNARIWIQKDEYEHYTNDSGAVLDRAIDPDDARMLALLRRAGRVVLVAGDSVEIMPGITVFTGGKHTFASQYATVRAKLAGGRTGTVVLASDNAYLYENLDQHRPIAQSLDTLSNLRAQERMRRLASEPRLIVPGHDVDVFTRYPKPGNGIARIE